MQRTPKTRLDAQRLEDRSTPAVFATLNAGTLLVTGAPSTPDSAIRIAGDGQDIRVFDGVKQVASFRGVMDIDARPGGGTTLGIDLGTNRTIHDLSVQLGRGLNNVRLGAGQVAAARIMGVLGQDHVTVNGFKTGNMQFDAGTGKDTLAVANSVIGQLDVRSAEYVSLNTSVSVKSLQVQHRNDAVVVNSAAHVAGDLSVNSFGGSLRLDGSVAGNVTLVNAPRSGAPSSLTLNGSVGGGLSMIGTKFDDAATLSASSSIAGRTWFNLGNGDDAIAFSGVIGKDIFGSLYADLGAGNDRVIVGDQAKLLGLKAQVNLGEGDDIAVIAKSAYIQWLEIDGGLGKDEFQGPTDSEFYAIHGFESVN